MIRLTIAPDVVAPPGYAGAEDLVTAALALAPAARSMLEATRLRMTVCSVDTRSAAVPANVPATTDGLMSIQTGSQAHFASLLCLIARGPRGPGGRRAPDADSLASTLAHEAFHAVYGSMKPADTAAALAAIRQDGRAFIAAAERFGPSLRDASGKWWEATMPFLYEPGPGDPRDLGDDFVDGWDVLGKMVAAEHPDLCAGVGVDPVAGSHYWQFAVRLANAEALISRFASLGGDALDEQRKTGKQIAGLETEALAHWVQIALDASRRGLPVDPQRVAAARKLMADGTKALLVFADGAPRAFAAVASRAMDILSRDGAREHLAALCAMAEAAASDTCPDKGPADAARDSLVAASADAAGKLGVLLLDEMAAETDFAAAVDTLSLAGGQIERWVALGRGAVPMEPCEASRTAAVLAELPALAAGLSVAMDEAERRTGRVQNWHFSRGTGTRLVAAMLHMSGINHARQPHPPRDQVVALVNLQAHMAEAERHILHGRADGAAAAVRAAAGFAAGCGHPDMAPPLAALADACRKPGCQDAKTAALHQAWQVAFPGTDSFTVTVSDHQAAILGFRDRTKTVADGLHPMAAAAAETAVGGMFLRIADRQINSVIRDIGGAEPAGWLLSHPHYAPMLDRIYSFAAQGAATALGTGIVSTQAIRSRLDELHPSRGLDAVRAALRPLAAAGPSATARARACSAAYKAARLLPPAERTVASAALWNHMADCLLDAEEDSAPLTRQNIGGITQMLAIMRADLPSGIAEADGNPLDTATRLAAAMDRQDQDAATTAACRNLPPASEPPDAPRCR